MTDKTEDRRRIFVSIQCDTDRLYGTLDEAISYLKEIKSQYPDAELTEGWTGYEDMNLEFQYLRPETDQELCQRQKREREQKQAEENLKNREREREKRRLQAQIDELKNRKAHL